MKIVKVKKWLQIKKVIDRADVLFSVTKEFSELQENDRREALKERLYESDDRLAIIATNEINRRIMNAQKKQSLAEVITIFGDYYEQRDKSGI